MSIGVNISLGNQIEEVPLVLKISMTVKEWRDFHKQINNPSWPSHRVAALIKQSLDKADMKITGLMDGEEVSWI